MDTGFMSTLIDTLLGRIDWLYVGSIILINYLMLTYIVLKPNRWWKIGLHLALGLVLGEVWHVLDGVSFTTLIYSFPFSVLLYSWVIKNIMDKFNISYDNGKGLV